MDTINSVPSRLIYINRMSIILSKRLGRKPNSTELIAFIKEDVENCIEKENIFNVSR